MIDHGRQKDKSRVEKIRAGGKCSRRKGPRKQSKVRRQHQRTAQSRQRQRAKGLSESTLLKVSKSIFGTLLHPKQVLSVGLVTLAVCHTARMTIHAIGAALAGARYGCKKHGIKQVDRFLSNRKIQVVDLRNGLVAAVVGKRRQIDVSMDWTDFEKDDQTTLVLSLILRHGRAIPLVWFTEKKSTLKNRQTLYERTAVQALRDALPEDTRVTVVADRGFGNTDLYDHLLGIHGFDFIIRFRQRIRLHSDTYTGPAGGAVPKNGRIRVLRDVRLTGNRKGPYAVVLYKAAKMKDSWCLATSLDTLDGAQIVSTYGRRFECEECFRDLKDWRFGLALKHTTIRNEARREKLLLVFALAAFLLTLVGIESERLGCDRLLRANTSRKRTHSLFRQGRDIIAGGLPPELTQRCFAAARRQINLALNKGFCHAMA